MDNGRSMRAVKSIEGAPFLGGLGKRERNEPAPVLAQCAALEGPRWTRAIQEVKEMGSL